MLRGWSECYPGQHIALTAATWITVMARSANLNDHNIDDGIEHKHHTFNKHVYVQ